MWIYCQYSIYSIQNKMNPKSMILLLLMTILSLSFCQTNFLLQSRRITMGSPTSQQLTIPYLNPPSTNTTSLGLVLSLSSFTEGQRIGVGLVRQGITGFTVEASGSLLAFSYILVEVSQGCSTGMLTVLFLPVGLMGNNASALEESLVPVTGYNQMLQQYGTVEPFISDFVQQNSKKFPTSSINITWNSTVNSLLITRTPDITKLSISYLYYLKLSSTYMSILPPYGLLQFKYANSQENIFTGTRRLKLYKATGSYLFNWTAALTADARNVELRPLLVTSNGTRCVGIINGLLGGPAGMLNCVWWCNQTLVTLYGVNFCVKNSSAYLKNISALPITTQSITLPLNNPQICSNFRETGSSLFCDQCNQAKGYTSSSDGSCFCRQGSYFKDSSCQACTEESCPFVMEASVVVVTRQENSTQQLTVNLEINEGHPEIWPENGYSYSNLTFDLLINNVRTQFEFTSSAPSILSLKLTQFPYSQTYTLTLTPKTSILLYNSPQNLLYLTPQPTLTLSYTHPPTTQLIVSSMQAISNAAPFAALVSIIVGSKINLFSFMQASSMLYLSSYIGWRGYGSLLRVSLSQSFFKLTPTNLFYAMGISLPIQKYYSDDITSNTMLRNSEYQLYMSIAPEYLLSTLLQILLIQLLFRLVTLKLQPTQLPSSSVDEDGHITWTKKPYLIQYMQSQKSDMKTKLRQLSCRLQQKRIVFYTTLICSQLIYHSFSLFSQFRITVSTEAQLLNCLACIALMAVIVAFPCVRSHSPLVLLKSVGIVYKKRQYTVGRLFLYYVVGVVEVVVYGAGVALFGDCQRQTVGVVAVIVAKLVLLWRYIKYIQLAKNCLLLAFFTVLGIGNYFSNQIKATLEIVAIALMMSVCVIEILKILRSIIVLVLAFLKQPPSIKGKAIIKRIEEYKKHQTQT